MLLADEAVARRAVFQGLVLLAEALLLDEVLGEVV